MLRFLTDEDFNGRIIRGLLLRRSDLDLVRVRDIGLSGAMAASHWPAIRKRGHTAAFRAYARKSKRVAWIAYDQLHTRWQASVGGKDPFRAYRTYVNEGLASPDDPFKQELPEWVFGSEDFLRRMVALAEATDRHRHESTGRRLHWTVQEITSANE